jgi:hypothetical protein
MRAGNTKNARLGKELFLKPKPPARLDCELLEPRRFLTAGTWSTVTAAVPGGDGAQSGVVLTDGTIMVHGGAGIASASWYKLTPSSTGSYTAGTWSTLASSHVARLDTATEVLQNGEVWNIGGEYSGASSAATFTNTGEIYNPTTNVWTNIANFPQTEFGDDPSELLPNGQILAGYISGPQTYIYNPSVNTWTPTGIKLRNDHSDEESWVTLPDQSILSYDVFSSISTGTPAAQRYIPSTGTWVDAGTPPAELSAASVGYELGPAMMLPDGRAFFAGGINATAYYTPSTGTWAAGPNMPSVGGVPLCMADAPGAVLPDGNLLLLMSPQGGLVGGAYNFPSPSYVFELNPKLNVYTNVTPNLSNFNLDSPSYAATMLVLPTGQVAVLGDQGVVAVYTENGDPVASAAPVISDFTYTGSTGVYTLSGTNLNGVDEGANYGDDNEMSSNYPLLRLTDASGVVTYARTTNWSLTGIDQGAETATITLPRTDTAGAYLVQAVANGVASASALAVLVNANTTPAVTVQTDSNPREVDVVGGGSIKATFDLQSVTSIYVAGDNNIDTLTVALTGTGSISTTVQGGSSNCTIDVNKTTTTGPVIIDPSVGINAINVAPGGGAFAFAEFLASQQIGALTIGAMGYTLIGSAGPKKLIQANSIITSGTGELDITNNNVIVHNGNLATLTSEISSGLNLANGGYWNGGGITSSSAAVATGHLTSVGILVNNNAGSPIYGASSALGLFDGVSPGLADVLLKYTYYGDANLDGKVDGSDYTLVDHGFAGKLSGWYNGDFDYNTTVNGSDYTLIDNDFNTQGAKVTAMFADDVSTSVPKSPVAVKTTAIASPTWVAGSAVSFAIDDQKPKTAASFLFSEQAINNA